MTRISPEELPRYSQLFVIADPGWDRMAYQEWMRIVGVVARTIDMLTLYDPAFAERVREWHTLSSDLDVEAFVIADEFSRREGPAVIPAQTMDAEIFSILEGCDLFKYVSPYYQFAFSPVIRPDSVRSAVYRLLDTQDADENDHPEKIISCTRSENLPPELSVLEKAPSSFIYRSGGQKRRPLAR